MNKSEAQEILSEQLARYCSRSHSELSHLVETEHVETYEISAASGTRYQVEVQFFWDDQPGDVIRVVGSIDDRDIRAFFPLSDSVFVTRNQSLGAK